MIIILCGLAAGSLLFLLWSKQEQIANRQAFVDDYQVVTDTVHVPDRYDMMNDSMQSAVVHDLLATRLQQSQDELVEHQQDVRTNLLLLAKDFQGARSQLASPITADDRYDQATIDLLHAWDMSDTPELTGLSLSHELLSQSKYGLTMALSLPSEDALDTKIQHNFHLAEDIDWLVSMKLILARYEDMFTRLTTLDRGLDVLTALLGEINTLLDKRTPTDPLLISCKDPLENYIPVAQYDVQTSSTFVETYTTALSRHFGSCLATVDQCVSSSALLYSTFVEVIDEVRSKLRMYSEIFYDLDELLLQGYDGPLISFCGNLDALEDTSSTSLSETLQQLVGEIEQSAPAVGLTGSGGEGVDDQYAPLDQGREEYMLDEIKRVQEKRLQQKSDLEQQEGYSPHQLLEDMFDSFDGNDAGFDRTTAE